jgi:hypothetical protein
MRGQKGAVMGEFEAIGDAVTGGLIGRAVEPRAGEPAADGHTHEGNCLNCGTPLVGSYCHACGQHAHVHRTLTAFFHDFLHGVLHFEGKIWRTLPMLAWKPGELTRRYIDGERARFISPVALFLFSVFLMFAAVSLFSGIGELPAQAKQDIQAELGADKVKLAKLEQKRDIATKAGQATGKYNEKIGDLRDEIKALEAVGKGNLTTPVVNAGDELPGWLGGSISKAAKNPELVAYKLKTNAYKFSWLIIPLSVPFVWLLFPFSRRWRLYDHTVFVTYSLCFMSLLVVAGLLFGAVGMAGMAGVLWLIPPFHMYRQLKGAYALGRAGALWRTTLLTLFSLLVVSLFAALLVGVGMVD